MVQRLEREIECKEPGKGEVKRWERRERETEGNRVVYGKGEREEESV